MNTSMTASCERMKLHGTQVKTEMKTEIDLLEETPESHAPMLMVVKTDIDAPEFHDPALMSVMKIKIDVAEETLDSWMKDAQLHVQQGVSRNYV